MESDYSDCGDYEDDYFDQDDPYEHNAAHVVDNPDPEHVSYQVLSISEVEGLINEEVSNLTTSIPSLPPFHCKLLLTLNGWDVEKIKAGLAADEAKFLEKNGLKSPETASPSSSNAAPSPSAQVTSKRPRISFRSSRQNNPITSTTVVSSPLDQNECGICFERDVPLYSLTCSDAYCSTCWAAYLKTQVEDGNSVRIECMQRDCHIYCQEDFVLRMLSGDAATKGKYEQHCFREFVTTNPYLRFCPGVDCQMISYCKAEKPYRCTCKTCNTSYCIKCGQEYHAPATCDILKMWKVKCADDSETANYISAHTKDCPNCHACIEKNGGCNHMQCTKCKHHFCWMCFRDWKSHGSEYYECSRYRENPAVAQEANHLKARRALEKYLHYFERFENHSKSLKMEEELRERIKRKINEKVAHHDGTWIDWQYLHDAASLLTKCRYTLQFTYPFAYYMDGDPRKELFEYQQAQLEKEIEELSWKVERAETTDRGDLENQMHVAEQKRRTLLQDFLN